MGVVSTRWMESMGVANGCGCNEVYRYPHITYPYSSVNFCSSIPTFRSLKKKFFVLLQVLFVIKFYVLNNFFAQYKHTMFYIRRRTHKRTLHILRWILSVRLQGAQCGSRSRGRALYRDASRAAYVLGLPPSRARGGYPEIKSGVNVSL